MPAPTDPAAVSPDGGDGPDGREDPAAGVLGAVLDRTEAALGGGPRPDPADAELVRRLAAVAAAHPGPAAPGAAAGVVDALLHAEFGGPPASPALRDALREWVAKTLLADPAARGRLEALWPRLRGAAGLPADEGSVKS